MKKRVGFFFLKNPLVTLCCQNPLLFLTIGYSIYTSDIETMTYSNSTGVSHIISVQITCTWYDRDCKLNVQIPQFTTTFLNTNDWLTLIERCRTTFVKGAVVWCKIHWIWSELRITSWTWSIPINQSLFVCLS